MTKRAPKMPEVENINPIIAPILEKGRRVGFVTHQEILQVLPNPEKKIALIDELCDLLQKNGIEMKEGTSILRSALE